MTPPGHNRKRPRFAKCRRSLLHFAGLLLLLDPGSSLAGSLQPIGFPPAADGRLVLPVDLHTHTVFSDGEVWPSVRVREAIREGLAGLAITDHLEWQPHKVDLPNADRNRSFAIATDTAREVKSPLIIIRGAEITRGLPTGHINAVFLKDVNALVPPGYPTFSKYADVLAFFQADTPANWRSVNRVLVTAHHQGAFAFFNHPVILFDRDGRIVERDDQLVRKGLVQGIEVANGASFYEPAFAYALANNLAVLGNSDLHDPAASDGDDTASNFALEPSADRMRHRTVTLVLAKTLDAASIHTALATRDTAALYDGQLIGPPRVINPILAGALRLERREGIAALTTEAIPVRIHNASSIPFLLRVEIPLFNATDTFKVPPRGFIDVGVSRPGLKTDEVLGAIQAEVLNAYVAPRTHPTIELRERSDAQ